jgi:predicted XRE-type DNA-binding protein
MNAKKRESTHFQVFSFVSFGKFAARVFSRVAFVVTKLLLQVNPMKLTPRERFLAKVCPEPKGGCWLWRGQLRPDGYGVLWLAGKSHSAHRAAWTLFRGEITPGLLVCHTCDVRACVNPEHLFLGTHTDNARDREQKGRSKLGEEVHSAKLSTKQVSRIKRMLAEGCMYQSELARAFGVTHPTIRAIARGTTWRHVKAAPLQTVERNDDPIDQAKQESVLSGEVPNHDL